MPPLFPQNVSAINRTYEQVLSCYRWHIKYLHTDEHAIRIEYSITPPLSPVKIADGSTRIIGLWGEAVDELGNEYQSAGGAYGMSADKQSTEGVLSFTPLPAVGATSLTIRMELLAGGDKPESIAFTVILSSASGP